MNVRSLLKDLLPPVVARTLRHPPPSPPPFDFRGDYATWTEATAHCTGYDARNILETTRTAALKVQRGEAAFERDSVVFAQPEFCLPMLAGMARAAAIDGGRLSVLDFGGSLGSSYFQSKPFLTGMRELRWSVVEQAAYVGCGQAEFASEELQFFATAADCVRARPCNVLLLSSVLQYLREPYQILGELCRLGIPNLIVDRTAFIPGDRDRLTMQTVPERIYPASYPAWLFNEQGFVARLARNGYRVLADFPGFDRLTLADAAPYFKGFICVPT